MLVPRWLNILRTSEALKISPSVKFSDLSSVEQPSVLRTKPSPASSASPVPGGQPLESVTDQSSTAGDVDVLEVPADTAQAAASSEVRSRRAPISSTATSQHRSGSEQLSGTSKSNIGEVTVSENGSGGPSTPAPSAPRSTISMNAMDTPFTRAIDKQVASTTQDLGGACRQVD